VTIGKTATRSDWRELRGAACVASGPQPLRPPLQAAPFDAAPCRAFFRAPSTPSIKPSARLRPPQAARRSDAPLLLLDPLSQSCDVSDDDAAVIGVDQASPFEGAEHQCDGFPSRAYVARNLLMSELHTNQDSP